jgi:hypothetical protein
MDDQRPADPAGFIIVALVVVIFASAVAEWFGYLGAYQR